MGKFIQSNDLAQLHSCHPILAGMAQECVRRLPFDCFVVYGHRTVAEQQALFALGRTRPGRRVTNIDGVTKLSRHNHQPSLAVDLAPAAVIATGKWKDTPETNRLFDEIGACMKRVAQDMAVTDYRWGGDFRSLKDRPHHEIMRNP